MSAGLHLALTLAASALRLARFPLVLVSILGAIAEQLSWRWKGGAR